MRIVSKEDRSREGLEALKAIFQAKVVVRKEPLANGPGRESSPSIDKIKEILGVKNLTNR